MLKKSNVFLILPTVKYKLIPMYQVLKPLPASSLPKQGEQVTWFAQNAISNGELRGYDGESRPVILNQFGNPNYTNDIFSIRPTDPNNRITPNWDRIPVTGKIINPQPQLNKLILSKLSHRIPPGPSYYELIYEMYQRGYETYLVGGTVRDFIQGAKSNDIDLVTSMPLKSSLSLIKSMFGNNYSANLSQGYVRVGGSPNSGDPFIDIKNFWLGLGNGSRIYGSEIIDDYKVRDFACNSVYYDPINQQLIDPSGVGYDDSINKNLTIIKDLASNTPKSNAQILIRFIKFSIRGYGCNPATLAKLKEEICPLLAVMTQGERMDYIIRQVLNKAPAKERKQHYTMFVAKMEELGIIETYRELIQPYETVLTFDNE